MIDWSKLGWNEEELTGIAEIRLKPRIQSGAMIAVQTEWVNDAGQIIRADTHIEVLKPLLSEGQTGE